MYQSKNLELYMHIPFCVKKCAYCDFLSGPQPKKLREAYVQALRKEILETGHLLSEVRPVTSIFFGGGTPSILSAQEIGTLLMACRESFCVAEDCEISMECNPGTVSPKAFAGYREAGINRLSFGLQSVHDEELKLLGRIHTMQMFRDNYQAARQAGFGNINVDLMSALPGQTMESWEESLRCIAALKPEHISAYSLIIEEGTPFYEKYGEDEQRRQNGETPLFLPTEETERLMFSRTGEILQGYGYHRYEISNYAAEGYECRHNVGYWIGTDYLGLGLGASSLYKGMRYVNVSGLTDYLECEGDPARIHCEEETLSEEESREEFFFLGLRMTKGISEKEYQDRFHETLKSRFGEKIEHLKEEGLLWEEAGRLMLTEEGIGVSNAVFAELLA